MSQSTIAARHEAAEVVVPVLPVAPHKEASLVPSERWRDTLTSYGGTDLAALIRHCLLILGRSSRTDGKPVALTDDYPMAIAA